MNNEKKWYAVYTRSRFEKKVAEVLTKRNIEAFCPLNKVKKQWSDRKKIVDEPLFSCYVFVRVSEAEHTLVKKADGVLNLVYWLGKPAVIRDEEIETIKSFLTEYTNIKLEKIDVNVSDLVKIVRGPLMEMEGAITEVRHKTCKVFLPSLGYAMTAEVEMSNIKVIAKGGHAAYNLSRNVNARF
jgi:transcription antitermination factor NusG